MSFNADDKKNLLARQKTAAKSIQNKKNAYVERLKGGTFKTNIESDKKANELLQQMMELMIQLALVRHANMRYKMFFLMFNRKIKYN